MEYPVLKMGKERVHTVNGFTGYDHRPRAGLGAFYDTENMSLDAYPFLASRQGRKKVMKLKSPQGMIEKNALAYIDDGRLYYNGLATPLEGISPGEKRLVSMGAYICVFPDKLYYNTADPGDFGAMEARFSYDGEISYAICDANGQDYPSPTVSAYEPAAPEDGDYWLEPSDGTLYRWNEGAQLWSGIDSVYIKLTFTTQGSIGRAFSQYDGVEVKAAPLSQLKGSKIIYALGGKEGTPPEYTDGERDYIVLINEGGISPRTETGHFEMERTVPDMDFVIECQNRLWGCFYGNDGEKNLNELYACALGDFKNWHQFMGLSTDSWCAGVGSDGVWSGGVNYMGNPVFFKENRIHTISPSALGAHQVTETPCQGVEKGSGKSLQVINGVLYYKTRGGVCAYQGGFPVSVSQQLGDELYHEATAGALGEKYYISMKDSKNIPQMFVYDTGKGLWIREDNFPAAAFAAAEGKLYALAGDSLYLLRGEADAGEEKIEWSCVSGLLGCEDTEKKTPGDISVRLAMDDKAEAEVYIQYDSGGNWEYGGRIKLLKPGSVSLPLRVHRCDHFRIKLAGKGSVKILSLSERRR